MSSAPPFKVGDIITLEFDEPLAVGDMPPHATVMDAIVLEHPSPRHLKLRLVSTGVVVPWP